MGMTTNQYRSIHSHIVLTLSKFLYSLLQPNQFMCYELTIFEGDMCVAHVGRIGDHKVLGPLLARKLRPALHIKLQLIATLSLIACLIRLICNLQMPLEILLHLVVRLDYTHTGLIRRVLQFIRKVGDRPVENFVTQVLELCIRRAALKTVVLVMHG
jgi:hypothetical protein